VRGRQESDDRVDRWSRSDWWGVVLEAPDARALAHFYADLLGWEIAKESDEDCALAPTSGVAYLATQRSVDYVRPVWPNTEGRQQMMLHLDFEVTDLQASVAHAIELGAEVAEWQPKDNVRVMLDPAGHPFCLYTGSEVTRDDITNAQTMRDETMREETMRNQTTPDGTARDGEG
jgi:catechol 2,3-dioxygenase-like lactoylglutathione lyase family enzyme